MRRLCLLIPSLILVACTPAPQPKPESASLYVRLGGTPAISAVVDEFVIRVVRDDRIKHFFKAAIDDPGELASFKTHLAQMICQTSGGPCTYEGQDMRTAHEGMGITNADFDALVEDLVLALTVYKVGEREKGELLGALGPLRKDIIE